MIENEDNSMQRNNSLGSQLIAIIFSGKPEEEVLKKPEQDREFS